MDLKLTEYKWFDALAFLVCLLVACLQSYLLKMI